MQEKFCEEGISIGETKIYIQLKSDQTTWLLNKPYVNEVILRVQNLSSDQIAYASIVNTFLFSRFKSQWHQQFFLWNRERVTEIWNHYLWIQSRLCLPLDHKLTKNTFNIWWQSVKVILPTYAFLPIDIEFGSIKTFLYSI